MSFLTSVYSKIPKFGKNIWRAIKLSKYERYTDSSFGLLNSTGAYYSLAKLNNVETYSQCAQDAFVFNVVFNKAESGTFLDVGGNHPITYNNSFLFEKHDWTGLAFEPQPGMHSLWAQNRKTECIQAAVGAEERTVSFIKEGEGSEAMLSHIDSGVNSNSYLVKQCCLKNIVKERGISHIDFLSCDVEGYELEVLKGIDFSKVDIDCILIENEDHEVCRAKKVRDYLFNNDFVMIARLEQDDVWISKRYLRTLH